MITATLPVKGLNFAGCAREIEKHLSKLDGIALVEASYVSQTVTVTYDEHRLSDTQLRELIKDCGFLCGEPWSETSNPALSSQLSTLHATMPLAPHMSAMEHVDGLMPLWYRSQQRLLPLIRWRAWRMRGQGQHLHTQWQAWDLWSTI
jgi:copper chaperone CopZ